mmetsp:Transcript_19284/g.58237  ORF Transcript_19284/g.58237 Transcript_19284/m.58237 type:complete len:229 (-) Transcript_19284:917-1603(-)
MCIHVRHGLLQLDVEAVVGAEIVVVGVGDVGAGEVLREALVLPHQHRRFVRPAPGHVVLRVTPASSDEHRHPKRLHEAYSVCVTRDRQVEATQPIVCERISPTLQHDCARLEHRHDLLHDGFEEAMECDVIRTVAQRHVHAVISPMLLANVFDVTGSRKEEVAVLVEAHRHHTVGQVEGLLHAVAMMHIDVQVQHPRMHLQQLQNPQHQVVHVAEPARLGLLSMVESP